ncbi:MAG: alpha/beta fold hydrolase [Dehalococcoidia bacterium]
MPGEIGYVRSPDGTRIGFERYGSGPPLVLVHGTSADRTRWQSVAPALSERFSVFAIDRRGRGLSGDEQPYALDREFEDVAAVVASIAEPVYLLGHSFGGLCALEAVLRAGNVRRLILYEPGMRTGAPIPEAGMRSELQALLRRGERDALLALFFKEVVGVTDEQLDLMRADPAWARRLLAAHTIPREFDDLDYILHPERFRGLTLPILLLAGNESPRFLREATELLRAALQTSRVVTMRDEAHIAMTTSPALFVRLVIEFCDEGP